MSSKSLLIGNGFAAIVVVLASVVANDPAAAKPQYASQTGKACGVCHANPAGGGKLTAAGEKFKQTEAK